MATPTQGNVYVFSSWRDTISSFTINGAPSDLFSGSVPGSSTAATNKYTPGSNTGPYPRFNNAVTGSPSFFASPDIKTPDNRISFFTQTGTSSKQVTIAIPGQNERVDIHDDLIIYITQNYAIVMDENGFVFGNYAIH